MHRRVPFASICAMAETRLRFGTQSSADVKLFLKGPGEKEYGKNPVYLHSQILGRLKGFEGKFSNRSWVPVIAANELWVTTSHNFDHYLKCIEIMYGEPVDFPNIEECLAILSVAFEMSSDECVNKCMQYLEAVRWSAEEESQIRRVLSCEGLKLKFSPDLAARLHQDDEDEDINFVEKSIQQMVSLLKGNNSALSKSREIVQKEITRMLDGNTSRDVLDVCERVLLQEFKVSIDSCQVEDIKFLFNLIQHCNGGILEASIRAFFEDAKFLKFVNLYSSSLFLNEPVFDIITWFMKATGDGKIITSRDSRVTFLTTWLPIIGKMSYDASPENRSGELDRAVLSVVEGLPQVDQKRICLLWADVYTSNNIDIPTPFALSQRLLKAHSNFAAKK